MQVVKNIFLIGGVGFDSNIYIIDDRVVVDTGTGSFFYETKNEIINMGFDVEKINTIVNTHCHFDHTGADKKFRDWLKAKVMIHRNDAYSLEHGDVLADLFKCSAKSVTVDKALDDKDVIRTRHFNFEVIHTPGHTAGSICLYERRRRILISGDTLFSDGFGRTDYPSGSAEDMFNSLKRLSKLKTDYLLPGHGQPKMGDINFTIKHILHGGLKVGASI